MMPGDTSRRRHKGKKDVSSPSPGSTKSLFPQTKEGSIAGPTTMVSSSSSITATSSRVMIKNLPKHYKEKRLADLMEQHGTVTQIKFFPRRRFAYVGFMDERQARNVIKHFNGTFIDTSKIEVLNALSFGNEKIPRPWSRFSKGSSANSQKASDVSNRKRGSNGALGISGSRAKREQDLREDREKVIASHCEKTKKRLKKSHNIIEELYEVDTDSKLKEFVDLHKNRSQTKTWSNDLDPVNHVFGSSKLPDSKKIKAKVTASYDAVASKKTGGDGMTLYRQRIRFEDSDDEDINDYQELAKIGHGPNNNCKIDIDEKKSRHRNATHRGNNEHDSSSEQDDGNGAGEIKDHNMDTNSKELSDADWLKSKISDDKQSISFSETSDSEVVSSSESERSNSEDDADISDNYKITTDNRKDDGFKVAQSDDPTLRFTLRLRGLPFSATEQDIKEFLYPTEAVDIRMPKDRLNRPSGVAFVDVATLKELKECLKLNKSYMEGRYIEVFRDKISRELDNTAHEEQPKAPRKEYPNIGVHEDIIADTGRLFVRNLSYQCSEDDLKTLFEKFGPLSEVLIPVDTETKKSKALGFVTFLMPEHAIKAYMELDGEVFQGRLLHILAAKNRDETKVDQEEGDRYKRKRDTDRKSNSESNFNWNSLFIRSDTIAEAMAESYDVEKSEILDPSGERSVAVRMALGETQIVAKTKEFLQNHGVRLDAFEQNIHERSKTAILVKNIPYDTEEHEIRTLFEKHGTLLHVVLPPSKALALVEYTEPSEARNGYRKLAYRSFKHEPLYLEWAPTGVFASSHANTIVPMTQENSQSDVQDSNSKVDAEEINSATTHQNTLFVKNLHFDTDDDELIRHFEKIGPLRSAKVATKRDPNNVDKRLSLGFGFIEYRKLDDAKKALRNMQNSELRGHKLELKISKKTAEVKSSRKAKIIKQGSTKLLARNLAFEVTKKEVRELFATFGQVKSVRMPKKFDGSHRGFAFVDFLSKEEAKSAFEALASSTHLYGRRIVIEWAAEEDTIDQVRDKTKMQYSVASTENTGKSKSKRLRL